MSRSDGKVSISAVPPWRMSFKAIFFDSDGLLVDTERINLQATHEIFSSIGVEISWDWYIRENLQKGRSSFELAREKGISETEIEKLWWLREKRIEELLKENVPVIDGVYEVLEKIQGKFVLGVVTSRRKEPFETILNKTDLRRFFQFFITRDDVENIKPHPDPYLKAVEFSGERKEDCVALEDSQRGVQSAKDAGITCFAIPSELTREHYFSTADKVLNSIRELPEHLMSPGSIHASVMD